MRPSPSRLLLAAVLLTSCRTGTPPPPFQPVADVKQLMTTVVEPAAEVYWDAVGTIIDQAGVHEIEPQSVEEWEAVRNSAYVFAEAGNLLMMGTRAKDGGDWMTMSQALIDTGQKAIRAAEARNKAAVFDAGAEVYEACTNCHAKYAAELQRPNARP